MKTTKKHFEIFKKEVEKWIKNFGLFDWEIQVEHGNISNNDNSAECQYNIMAKNAVLRLNTNFTETQPFTDKDVRAAAFHEVAELLLCRLGFLAENRYITYNEIEIERHSIIARLLNYMIDK